MDILGHIGQRARQRRKQLKLSQSEAAANIHTHRNDISRIENAKFTGSIVTVVKYLDLLGLTLTVATASRPTLDDLPGVFGIEDD